MSNEQETKTRKPKRTIAEQLADLRAKKSAEIAKLNEKSLRLQEVLTEADKELEAARAEFKEMFGEA